MLNSDSLTAVRERAESRKMVLLQCPVYRFPAVFSLYY